MREHPDLLEERFGPVVLLLTYGSRDELLDALLRIDGQLTGSIHAEAQDADLVALLAVALGERSGRLIFDGFPTGVAVTYGMHHGGPFPATTAPAHTSVGMTAIRRFLRPVAFQNAPEHVLAARAAGRQPAGDLAPRRRRADARRAGSVVDDAHRDARRARRVGERQEVAHGGGVVAERAAERIGRRRRAGAERDRRVAERAGEGPGGQVTGARDEAVRLAPASPSRALGGWAPGRRSRAGRPHDECRGALRRRRDRRNTRGR